MTIPPRLSLPARFALAVVRGYQRYLSPRKPPICRFTPSCSEYMVQAIMRFGAWRGIWLGVKRLCRCAPWHPGGYDPVPDAPGSTSSDPTVNG